MENKFFSYINNNFGFGMMRLPMLNENDVDIEQTKKMVDEFIAQGFNYFDTAHGYLKGESEKAVKACLSSRYDRSRYILTDKLTGVYFEKQEDIEPLLMSQLEACGVEYFDFYLMHAQNAAIFEKFKACKAYETAFEMKKKGLVKHVGLSFHDKAEVLDKILTEYPEVEVVQLQFNYLDYEDNNGVQSRMCYEVAEKHGKPVIVMEPIRGGNLISMPDNAEALIQAKGVSKPNLALRFAASFDNIMMVLSGMNRMSDMQDNLSFMKDFQPLSAEEKSFALEVAEAIRANKLVPCTGCRYCVEGCPMNISIPDLFTVLNNQSMFKTYNGAGAYAMRTNGKGKAGDCIGCGQCEAVCPQQLPIRDLLQKVAETFEK